MENIPYPYLPKNKEIKLVDSNNPFILEAKRISELSGCAKQATGSVIVKDGVIIGKGTNAGKKLNTCPREEIGSKTGEDYHLCKDICLQEGHSEVMAIINTKENGNNTNGADLYLYGHWWCCKNCWNEMLEAGINNVFLSREAYNKFKH